jgi:hypothetical protein
MRQVARQMSLNRTEQLVSDYVERHPEERSFWVEKVRGVAQSSVDDYAAANSLAAELWRYVEERSAVSSPFRELAQREGLRRTSMRNLAEYWLRLWTAPKSPRTSPAKDFSGEF